MTAPVIPMAGHLLRIYDALVFAADAGASCPSNNELADSLGQSPGYACAQVKALEKRGLITVRRGNCSRIVTIVATGRSTGGAVPEPHWRDRPDAQVKPKPTRRYTPRATPIVVSDVGRPHPDDLAARIDADQVRLRAPREHWLTVEQQRYGLPQRGRLIEEMPA